MPRTGLESEEAYWDDLASRLREVLDRFRAPMSAEAEVKYLGYIVEWLESTEAHYQGADDSLYGCDLGGLSYVAIERSTADVKTASRSDRNRVSFEPEHIRRARHALTAEIMLFGRSLIEAGKQALPVEATMASIPPNGPRSSASSGMPPKMRATPWILIAGPNAIRCSVPLRMSRGCL